MCTVEGVYICVGKIPWLWVALRGLEVCNPYYHVCLLCVTSCLNYRLLPVQSYSPPARCPHCSDLKTQTCSLSVLEGSLLPAGLRSIPSSRLVFRIHEGSWPLLSPSTAQSLCSQHCSATVTLRLFLWLALSTFLLTSEMTFCPGGD